LVQHASNESTIATSNSSGGLIIDEWCWTSPAGRALGDHVGVVGEPVDLAGSDGIGHVAQLPRFSGRLEFPRSAVWWFELGPTLIKGSQLLSARVDRSEGRSPGTPKAQRMLRNWRVVKACRRKRQFARSLPTGTTATIGTSLSTNWS
jgi:hypothetical protein